MRGLLIRLVVTAVTLFYGIVPAIADLNETHLLNPGWSPHARLHAAWFLVFAAGVAGVSLWLLWARREIVLPIIIGLCFTGGFFVATIAAPFYGAALTEPEGYTERILGLDSNLFLFSVVTLVLLAALSLRPRS